MHPYTQVVFGVEVRCEMSQTVETLTKYNENTGAPYSVTRKKETINSPDWVERLLEERRKIDDAFELNRLGIFQADSAGRVFLVGRLIQFFEPEDCSNPPVLPAYYDSDRAVVSVWLKKIGAVGFDIQDVQFRIGIVWL